ncbi:hypothetical protein GWC95_01035 [Sediminibacterium roseum]|uniref:Uncharacterized protein n=1 Tax=Sediminibacterium roseum TaxID=1978412 RepID=A0ABW9ZUE5_9BACT|nr:hypothetical protein [Sediminibacterium roseum]NCI48486.1 hypothetical protein [Sediminibacterium roseum]
MSGKAGVEKKQKTKPDNKVKDYGNDPFFVNKAKRSKEVLDKYGFPRELVNRRNTK